MVSRLKSLSYGLVCVVTVAVWAGGVSAAVRYDTATPHTPPYRHRYIPVGSSSYNSYETDNASNSPSEEEKPSGMPPSQFVLNVLRTAVEVFKNYNKKKTEVIAKHAARRNATLIARRRWKKPKNATVETGRGFDDYYDEHHHDDTTTTTTPKPMKQGRYTDPWAGYYDWIINEGSFKFWSVFQLFTAALLLYACFSAIYYAKFNPIIPDYDREYDDYFLERSIDRKKRSLDPSILPSGFTWIDPRTFQFILDAIVKNYEE